MHSTSAERGSVTAELAVLLPAITLLFGIIIFTAQLGLTQLRLDDAARAGARQAARGEAVTGTVLAAKTIAGESSTVAVSASPDFVTVTVAASAQGPFAGMLGWRLSAQASARVEQSFPPEEPNFVGVSP